MALLTGKPRSATVKTTSPVRALVVADRQFKRLLQDVPSLAPKLLASVAARLAEY